MKVSKFRIQDSLLRISDSRCKAEYVEFMVFRNSGLGFFCDLREFRV